MCVAPRGYTDKEQKRIQKSYNEQGAGHVLKTGESSAVFKDRNDMMKLEDGVCQEIKKSFKPRLEALEELHQKEHGIVSVKEQDAKVKTQ